jgi:hypothetical protein
MRLSDISLLLAQALVVVAVVALVLALVVFMRRAGKFIAETREAERFRRTVADLSARIVTSLDGVSGRIDGVRRHTVAADAISDSLTAAADAVVRYADEARALDGPEPAAPIRDALVNELERAKRALQIVEHGCGILASARSDLRTPEAETSIKRGYLNILHAREAIMRHAARAADVGVTPPRLFERRGA